jgi:acetyl esterase/lipase
MKRPRWVCALVILALAGITGCGGARVEAVSPEPETLVAANLPYSGDRYLDVRAPESDQGGLPVVVLLHGCCGDRADVVRLADRVAAEGAVVMTPDWGGTSNGATYPDVFEAVACAVRYARQNATAYGGHPDRVVLAGWSDGALAAAVVGMTGDLFPPDSCTEPGPPGRPDAVVGLAGYYGWTLPVPDQVVTERTVRFMGGTPDDRPSQWERATPHYWIDRSNSIPISLIVSADDELRADAEAFHRRLDRAGWPVRLDVVPVDGEPTLISPRSSEGLRAVDAINWAIRQAGP